MCLLTLIFYLLNEFSTVTILLHRDSRYYETIYDEYNIMLKMQCVKLLHRQTANVVLRLLEKN